MGRKQLLYGILWISGVNIHSPAMQKPGIYTSMDKNPKAPSHKMTLSSESKTKLFSWVHPSPVKVLPILCSTWSRCLRGWQFKSDGLTAKARQTSDSGLSPSSCSALPQPNTGSWRNPGPTGENRVVSFPLRRLQKDHDFMLFFSLWRKEDEKHSVLKASARYFWSCIISHGWPSYKNAHFVEC